MSDFSRVLVTGGAGFIGSHLVKALVNKCAVIVLDNLCSGSLENLHRVVEGGGIKFVRGDVRDKKAVRDAMNGVDAVVHLAALINVEASVKNPFETHDVNVNGTLNVLKEAVRAGVKRFVFASSAAVYGDANPLPLKEEYPPHPISPYAASKAAAEGYCLTFNRCYGLETVILRYFNVYGPGQGNSAYSGVITKFLRNALKGEPLIVYGDGEQTRDFIYVDDVAKATVLALENENAAGETFNVSSGKPTTINELVEIVKEFARCDLKVIYKEPRKGDVRHNYGDPAKAEKILGFKAMIGLRKGLEQLANKFLPSDLSQISWVK
jgi:dTDP-glucose 4,6-dehydratase